MCSSLLFFSFSDAVSTIVYVQPVRQCAIKMICSEFGIHCVEDDWFDFQVAELQRMLRNEEKMHEVLEHAMLPPKTQSTLQIPSFLPRRVHLPSKLNI